MTKATAKLCPFKVNWIEEENSAFQQKTHEEYFGECDETKCPFYDKEAKIMYCGRTV